MKANYIKTTTQFDSRDIELINILSNLIGENESKITNATYQDASVAKKFRLLPPFKAQ